MAMTPFTGTYNSGDLQYVIPTAYSKKNINIFENKLTAVPLFTDMSAELAANGDNLSIPDLTTNAFSAQDKGVGSDYAVQSPAQGNTTLTIDTHKHVSYVIEKPQEKKMINKPTILGLYNKNATYRVAAATDTSILSLYSGLSSEVGDASSNVTDPTIRNALSTLRGKSVPLDNAFWIIHPDIFYEDLMGVTKFYSAEKAGYQGSDSPVRSGLIPYIYGLPVHITNQVVDSGGGYHNLLATPEAFAYAFHMKLNTESNYIPKQGGTLTTVESIYGVAELNDDAAVEVIGNSAQSLVS